MLTVERAKQIEEDKAREASIRVRVGDRVRRIDGDKIEEHKGLAIWEGKVTNILNGDFLGSVIVDGWALVTAADLKVIE